MNTSSVFLRRKNTHLLYEARIITVSTALSSIDYDFFSVSLNAGTVQVEIPILCCEFHLEICMDSYTVLHSDSFLLMLET